MPTAEHLRLWVERPERVDGPSNRADSPVVFFHHGQGVRGYFGNRFTYRLEGPDTLSAQPMLEQVIGPGTEWDDDGTWIQAIPADGSYGWYHAEQGQSPSFKTVAFAESHDGGLTFTKPDYPNNQVITPSFDVDAVNQGEGDPTVIQHGNYYYMFYTRRRSRWVVGVARALVSSRGVSGSWRKWDGQGWNNPGLGGETPDSLGILGSVASLYDPTAQVALFRTERHVTPQGIYITIGDIDPPGSFVRMKEPLMPLEGVAWSRPAPTELVGYTAPVGLYGGNAWSSVFVLYYLYIPPGGGYSDGYLVRRTVRVARFDTPPSPQVYLRMTRWKATEGIPDYWCTTALPDGPYTLDNEHLGYVLTVQPQDAPSKELLEYRSSAGDHIVVDFDPNKLAPGYVRLRSLGWIYHQRRPGTVPWYRCLRQEQGVWNHFISTDPNGEGLATKVEWRMGYALLG